MSDDLIWNLLATPSGSPGAAASGDASTGSSSFASGYSATGTTRNSSHIPDDVTPFRARVWVALIAAVTTGVWLDVVLQANRVGQGLGVLFAVVATGVLASRSTRTLGGYVHWVIVLGCAACLAVRSSVWLVAACILLSLASLALLASWVPNESSQRLRSLVLRVGHLVEVPFLLPVLAWRSLGRRIVVLGRTSEVHRHVGPIALGLALGAPVLLVLGLLLSGADAMFASLFSFDLTGLVRGFDHLVVFAVGFVVFFALAVQSRRNSFGATHPIDRQRLPNMTALTVLWSVAVLFAVFVSVQVIASRNGASLVRRTTGLSYADYARSGFFQLIWASLFTLSVLAVFRFLLGTNGQRARSVVIASEAVVVLTIALVVSAFVRFRLYIDTYGLTTRRVLVVMAIVVIGVTFALLGLRIAGVGSRREWITPAVLAVVALAVFAANVVNIERIVARDQIARSARGERSGLSSTDIGEDAVPELARALQGGRLQDADRVWALQIVCRHADRAEPSWVGDTASNRAARFARRKIDCS